MANQFRETYSEPKRLLKFRDLDHGGRAIDLHPVFSVMQFPGVTRCAVEPHNRIRLLRFRIIKVLLPREANRQSIRIEPGVRLAGQKAEPSQVSLVGKQITTE